MREMFDLKTNVLIQGLYYMSTTMKSAFHLGLNDDQNLIAWQNTNFEGKIHSKFWIYLLWCMTALRGRQRFCATTKQSEGLKQMHMSGKISHPSGANARWTHLIDSSGGGVAAKCGWKFRERGTFFWHRRLRNIYRKSSAVRCVGQRLRWQAPFPLTVKIQESNFLERQVVMAWVPHQPSREHGCDLNFMFQKLKTCKIKTQI